MSRRLRGDLFARDGDPSGGLLGPSGAAPGSDPFQELIYALENNITYGGMPKWFRGQMLAFAIFFIVIALVHLAALVVPFLRGPMSRSRHTWVARVKDVGVYSQPYLVPNGRVFASTFSMIASVLFVVQILLELYAPRRFNTAFMLIPLLPFYVTVWMSNFDALFAIWVSPIAHSHSWTDRLKHPWILNPLCWGVPTVVVIMESVFIARLWTLYSTLARDVWALVADLEQAETVFRQQGLGAVDFAELASMGDKVKGTFVSYNKRQAGALLSWSIWLVIASLLFFASLFLLVKTIHIRRGFPSRHGTGTNGPVFSKGSTTVHCRASPSRIRAQRLLLGYMSSLAALLVTFTVTVALTASLSWKARNLDANNGNFYQTLVVVLFWLIAISIGSLGVLSLSRVLELGTRADNVSRRPSFVKSATGGPAFPTTKAGLFADGEDTDSIGSLDSLEERADEQPPSGERPMRQVHRLMVTVERKESIEEADPEKKDLDRGDSVQ